MVEVKVCFPRIANRLHLAQKIMKLFQELFVLNHRWDVECLPPVQTQTNLWWTKMKFYTIVIWIEVILHVTSPNYFETDNWTLLSVCKLSLNTNITRCNQLKLSQILILCLQMQNIS